MAVDSSALILTLATFCGLTGPSQGFLYVPRFLELPFDASLVFPSLSCFAALPLQISVRAQHTGSAVASSSLWDSSRLGATSEPGSGARFVSSVFSYLVTLLTARHGDLGDGN